MLIIGIVYRLALLRLDGVQRSEVMKHGCVRERKKELLKWQNSGVTSDYDVGWTIKGSGILVRHIMVVGVGVNGTTSPFLQHTIQIRWQSKLVHY